MQKDKRELSSRTAPFFVKAIYTKKSNTKKWSEVKESNLLVAVPLTGYTSQTSDAGL